MVRLLCGPDEVPLEHAAEVQQIDDATSRAASDFWKFKPGRSEQWSFTAPRSQRYYRVQRLFEFIADGERVN